MSEKTLLSMAEAAEMVGLTRPTFYRKVEELDISVVEESGKKQVDVSELIRVFGSDFKLNNKAESKASENVSVDKSMSKAPSEDIQVRLAILENELENEKSLREEAKQEVEYFKEQVRLEKEEKQKITYLLEDHRSRDEKEGAWENSFKALENRIANQEKSAKEREEREQKILRQNRALRNALKEEQSKSIWKKLFG